MLAQYRIKKSEAEIATIAQGIADLVSKDSELLLVSDDWSLYDEKEMKYVMGLRQECSEDRMVIDAPGHELKRKDLIQKLGRIEDRPDWPEAIYLTLYHTKVSFTTETPKPFPLENRIQAQIAAVETLLNALLSSH